MPKFAYLGTPYVARDTLAQLVAAGYAPTVVITSPDARRGRGLVETPSETKAWAEERGIPVLAPEKLDASFLERLRAYDCDYGIAVAYGKIIPQDMLDAFPRGILNVHYSLLPAYRGASPVETALWHGDTVTGVTIQQMVYELDAGDVLSQEEMPIQPDDTTRTLRPRLIDLGADLLIRTLPAFLEGTARAVPQDGARASRAPKIRKEQGRLDLAADPEKNWNTYRALRESPGTYFFAEKGGKRIRVKVADALYEGGIFRITRIVPEGKSEQDFSYLEQAGWTPVS